MAWLAENWLWAVIFVAFIAMHASGHGGHGGHGGTNASRSQADVANDETQRRR